MVQTQTAPLALVKRIVADATSDKGEREVLTSYLVKGKASALALLQERDKCSQRTAYTRLDRSISALALTHSARALLAAQVDSSFELAQERAHLAALTGWNQSARLWSAMVRGAKRDPEGAAQLHWRRDADLRDGTAPIQKDSRHFEGAIRHSVRVQHSVTYVTSAREVSVSATKQWARRDAAAALLSDWLRGASAIDTQSAAALTLPYYERLRNETAEVKAACAAVKRAMGVKVDANTAAALLSGMGAPHTHSHWQGESVWVPQPNRYGNPCDVELRAYSAVYPLTHSRARLRDDQPIVDPTLPGYPTSQELASTAPKPRRKPQERCVTLNKSAEYRVVAPNGLGAIFNAGGKLVVNEVKRASEFVGPVKPCNDSRAALALTQTPTLPDRERVDSRATLDSALTTIKRRALAQAEGSALTVWVSGSIGESPQAAPQGWINRTPEEQAAILARQPS